MGDRGNIVVDVYGDQIYLYTHWSGYRLPQVVAQALDRGRDRWDDDAYLARILFNQLTLGSELSTTGYGISAKIGDGGTEVYVTPAGHGGNGLVRFEDDNYTFQEFIDKFSADRDLEDDDD